MSKESQPSAGKTQQKPKSPPGNQPVGREMAPADGMDSPLGVAATPSIEGQAGRLGNGRLGRIQRQVLAGQIGQMLGNSHLLQILSLVHQTQSIAPDQPQTPDTQSNGSHTSNGAASKPSANGSAAVRPPPDHFVTGNEIQTQAGEIGRMQGNGRTPQILRQESPAQKKKEEEDAGDAISFYVPGQIWARSWKVKSSKLGLEGKFELASPPDQVAAVSLC